MEFQVQLSYAMGVPVSATYYVQPITAGWYTGDLDPIISTVVFPPGTTNATLGVTLHGDLDFEPDKTFQVILTSPVNAILGRAQALGTILNDDPPPTASISDVALPESNSGRTNWIFTVQLSVASYLPITLDYATADGAASAGSDYRPQQGTLSFAPGVTILTINVPVSGDLAIEPDEEFYVNLSSPTNVSLSRTQGVGRILNDDGLPGRLHHFEVSPIATPQYVAAPVPVGIRAVNVSGQTVTDFRGRVNLAAVSGDVPFVQIRLRGRWLGRVDPAQRGGQSWPVRSRAVRCERRWRALGSVPPGSQCG